MCAWRYKFVPEAAGRSLAACTQLTGLRCLYGQIPSNFPPGLQRLTLLHISPAQVQRHSDWLLAAKGLSNLAELHLEIDGVEAVELRDGTLFSGFVALRSLTVDIACSAEKHNFTALGVALNSGVSVRLHLTRFWGLKQAARLSLWAALAQIPPLTLLHVQFVSLKVLESFAYSARELRLLDSVMCEQLALHLNILNGPFDTEQLLLPGLSCGHFFCRISASKCFAVDWSLVAWRPGVYILDDSPKLRVHGLIGRLPPLLPEPWALVLKKSRGQPAEGVPAHLLEPGPRGHLVWRNSAATDAVLERAYDALL